MSEIALKTFRSDQPPAEQHQEASVNSIRSTKVTLDQSPSPKYCVIQQSFEVMA